MFEVNAADIINYAKFLSLDFSVEEATKYLVAGTVGLAALKLMFHGTVKTLRGLWIASTASAKGAWHLFSPNRSELENTIIASLNYAKSCCPGAERGLLGSSGWKVFFSSEKFPHGAVFRNEDNATGALTPSEFIRVMRAAEKIDSFRAAGEILRLREKLMG